MLNNSPPTQPMLQVSGLTKVFGKNTAVNHISFTMNQGEVFGFLGPNGAGKTTTVRMLSALIRPTGGSAVIAGHELGKADREIRRNVGILTESPGLYDGLSAERNLGFFAVLYDIENPAAQVEKYLRMLGLWDRRHESVGTFSKGMRQKLAIARAMLHEPKILFLDEPTSGLDPEMSRLVRSFVADLKSLGRTIVLCTHNLDEADRLCDRVAIIQSSLLALDTPAALRKQLFGRTVVFHLGAPAAGFQSAASELKTVQSAQALENKLLVQVDNPEKENPEIIRALVAAGADIQFVGEVRRSLEDVYLQLVKSNPGGSQ